MLKMGQIVLAEAFEQRMANEPRAPRDVPIPIAAQHYGASLMTLLGWWMDHHYPYTPDEMERYFHRLVTRPIGGATDEP